MLQKSLIFLAIVAISSISCQLNLVSGRMAQNQCNSSNMMQKKPDFCALATNVQEMLSKISDPTSIAVITNAMNRLDSALKNESQVAMVTLIMLNQPLIDQFKKVEPENYEKLMALFNLAQQKISDKVVSNGGQATIDTAGVCEFYKKFQEIETSLSATGKQILGTLLCGIHQTIKQQMPKLFGQVISKQDFMNLIMKNPELMKELGSHFHSFFTKSMN